jgi:hypothetical protein
MSADLMPGNGRVPQSLNRYPYALNDPVNRLDPLGLASMFLNFTNCQRPFITQTFDDGHQETLTGDWVCSTFSMSVDFGPPTPLGPDTNKIDIPGLRERLWKALVSDPNCLQFLGIGGAVSVLSLLDKITIDVQDEGSSSIQAVTTFLSDPTSDLRPINPAIHINTNGYFSVTGHKMMMGDSAVATGTQLFQAIVMFHELGHGTGALPKDADNFTQSQANTGTIMQKCKDALKQFAGK